MDDLDKLADELAKDVIEVARRLKDDIVIETVAQSLGEGSQIAEEKFMSAVRFRRSITKARGVLADYIKTAKSQHASKAE